LVWRSPASSKLFCFRQNSRDADRIAIRLTARRDQWHRLRVAFTIARPLPSFRLSFRHARLVRIELALGALIELVQPIILVTSFPETTPIGPQGSLDLMQDRFFGNSRHHNPSPVARPRPETQRRHRQDQRVEPRYATPQNDVQKAPIAIIRMMAATTLATSTGCTLTGAGRAGAASGFVGSSITAQAK